VFTLISQGTTGTHSSNHPTDSGRKCDPSSSTPTPKSEPSSSPPPPPSVCSVWHWQWYFQQRLFSFYFILSEHFFFFLFLCWYVSSCSHSHCQCPKHSDNDDKGFYTQEQPQEVKTSLRFIILIMFFVKCVLILICSRVHITILK
jgi:hypothetical protein